MNFVKLSLLFFILSAAVVLPAETVRFRSGVLLAAQLTKRTIPVAGAKADAFPPPPANKIYAIVSLKLDPVRKISIFDYSLEAYGRVFPCIAINQKNRFEYITHSIMSDKPLQLLFILDAVQTGLQKSEKLKLKSNFPPAGVYDTDVVFQMLGSGAPAALTRVPAAGMFKSGANSK